MTHLPHLPHLVLGVVIVTAATMGCGGSEPEHGGVGRAETDTAGPDVPPPGFATVVLTAANPLPISSKRGATEPSGTVWYRLTDTPETGHSLAFEWYVRGRDLMPGRIYRIEVSVDDHATYSVGRGQSDSAGSLTAHGTLSRFADQYCVGTLVAPMALLGPH